MVVTSTYVVSAACLLAVATFDRLFLQRGEIDLIKVEAAGQDDENKFFRFALTFKTRHRLLKSELKYTVRDKKNPITVISGKTRTLDFSDVGLNQEFLLIKREMLTSGQWIIDVEATSLGSRINPLFKIFPITSRIREEVDIQL